MKLIDILVEELPKRGGWPKRANCITQDGDLKVEPAYCHPSVAKCDDDGFWFLDSSRIGGFKVDTLASDYTTAIITREQYESALAAKNDGWIAWSGGECPVPGDTEVLIKCKSEGAWDFRRKQRADGVSWTHDDSVLDVIAYRLHQPQQAEQPEASEEDMNECIGQAVAEEWNGEGLPPVGCWCEYSLNGGKTWWKCKVDYIVGTQGVVMLCDTFEGVQYVQFSSYGNALKFRPIRSEAERKRDEAGLAIYHAINWNAEGELVSLSRMEDYKKAYDAIAAGKIPGVKLDD